MQEWFLVAFKRAYNAGALQLLFHYS